MHDLDPSEGSTSTTLSSQPSLPSVPSLTPWPSISNQVLLQHDQLTQAPSAQHNCIATLKPHHSSYISSLVLSGNFFYTGSSDGQIRAWRRDHLPSTTINKTVATTNSAVKSLVVAGDVKHKLLLFSAHQDHKIRVWKIDINEAYFKCIATLPTLKDRFPKIFSPKSYVQIRRHKKCTWVHHADTVSALALSNDGSFLYSASWDRTFKIWRTSDFKCLESVSNAHDDAINAIVVSHDGTLVYTASADKKIKIWKKLVNLGPKNKRQPSVVLVGTLEKHKSAVNALAFSSDGSVLYSGACDRSIIVWESDRDRDRDHGDGGGGGGGNSNYGMVVVGALRGHSRAILCLAVVADLVCSGSADCSVRVWRRCEGLEVDDRKMMRYSCLAVLEGHKFPVKCLTATIESCNSTSDEHTSTVSDSGDSTYLVYSGSLACDIKVWQLRVPNVF